jgi:phage tail tape-measure protein
MERRDEELERDRELDERRVLDDDEEQTLEHHETHATTGGAAAAGAVTGGVIGLTGGPVGAAIGAVGGAILGAAAERMMHSEDDAERPRSATYTNEYSEGTRDVDVPSTDVTMEPTPTERRSSDAMSPSPREAATDVDSEPDDEELRRDRGTTGLP